MRIMQLYARGVGNPASQITREAQIGNNVIYFDDRNTGLRLTVIEPLTLKVIFDSTFSTNNAAGVKQLESALTKYNIDGNIIILTSSGNWLNGFSDNDFVLLAHNGFKKLTIALKSMSNPSYSAIINNNIKSGTERIMNSAPAISIMPAKENNIVNPSVQRTISYFNKNTVVPKNTPFDNVAAPEITSGAATINTQHTNTTPIFSVNAATSNKATGRNGIGISITGIVAVGIAGLVIYRMIEKSNK